MTGRTKLRRPWIKLYPIDCLDGSIRYQLEPAERSVWYDLLNFSAICAEPGIIADKDGRPYPRSFIANRLNIDVELLDTALAKCIDEGRIMEINGGVIVIVNWSSYQSEYQRQKPYRDKKNEDVESIPDFIDKKTWDAFIEMRKKKRAEPTAHAVELLLNKLQRFHKEGKDVNQILEQSIVSNWTDVYPLKDGQDGRTGTDKNRPRAIPKPGEYTKPPGPGI